MRVSSESIQRSLSGWLRQGISPQRLALTLALGFTIGCVPVVGVPTVLCAALALALRLNLPAIQAANYAAMPFQLLLIVPFLRLGGRLFSSPVPAGLTIGGVLGAGVWRTAIWHISPEQLAAQMGGMAGCAMLGWLLVAIPTVAFMFPVLTIMLRRLPWLEQDERIAVRE